ncbi:10745_t:CDS:2, partial [Racocetra persica]
AVKVKRRVQKTSYKASEKLAVIQKAKQIGVLAASHHFAAEEKFIIWFNELRQTGIAVIADSIKMKINTILSTTCADIYPDVSQQFYRTEDDLLYNSDKKNSEIDNNEDSVEVVEED